MNKKMISVGISNFEKLISDGCYYVDKTMFISDLINNYSKVTLITRPRRFGKTLSMSMLDEFLNIQKNSKELFKNLNIEKEIAICEKWLNKYPVIFLSFKKIEGLKFEYAYDSLKELLADLFRNFSYIEEDNKINKRDLRDFAKIADSESSLSGIKSSLRLLTKLLYQYYNQKVIILLNEYDVPLQKASINGYYEEMLDIIRAMMNDSLKDNPYLQFGVLI